MSEEELAKRLFALYEKKQGEPYDTWEDCADDKRDACRKDARFILMTKAKEEK